MKINRVANFEDGTFESVEISHFINTGYEINFDVTIKCSYPEDEWDDIIKRKHVIDPKKLKPSNKTYVLVYDSKSKFEDEYYGWTKEGGYTYVWENIKQDSLFFYAINSVSKEMIKEIFE